MYKSKENMLNNFKGQFDSILKLNIKYRQVNNKIVIFPNHYINRRSEFIYGTYQNLKFVQVMPKHL